MRFRTVIFDCDSTLSVIEGIEELARDHRQEIVRLTEQAMAGLVPLEAVYGRRLDLIRPSRAAIEAVGKAYIAQAVPGASETIRNLARAGVTLQILSGGLAPAVRVLGDHLGIPRGRVAAVEVHFTPDGTYAGFDETSLLTRAGGKRRWVEDHIADLPRPILLVGDGATDLEARPAVDCFAAFVGVVNRPEVARQADVVLAGPSLIDVLPLVLEME